jgi:hypothetical protein
MGRTWTKISPDLTTNDASKYNTENLEDCLLTILVQKNTVLFFTIAESPLNENDLGRN